MVDDLYLSSGNCRHSRSYQIQYEVFVCSGLESNLVDLKEKVSSMFKSNRLLRCNRRESLRPTLSVVRDLTETSGTTFLSSLLVCDRECPKIDLYCVRRRIQVPISISVHIRITVPPSPKEETRTFFFMSFMASHRESRAVTRRSQGRSRTQFC